MPLYQWNTWYSLKIKCRAHSQKPSIRDLLLSNSGFQIIFSQEASFYQSKILSKTRNISLNTRLFKLYASLRSVLFFSKREMRTDDHIIQCLILVGYGIFSETYPVPNSVLKYSLQDILLPEIIIFSTLLQYMSPNRISAIWSQ